MTTSGECLLPSLHYPAGPVPGTVWAAKHADIDLFKILPIATEEGLEVFYQDTWIPIKVPEDAVIINCRDMLQNLTNGYFTSSPNRVVAKPDTERYSIVYFLHPRDTDRLDPIDRCLDMTGGVCRYPKPSRLELLASGLQELGLASPELMEFEKNSGILQRIEELVEAEGAAKPVQKTYTLWKKGKQD